MRILALETSGRLGSVALLQDSSAGIQVVAEANLPAAERPARSLLPCVNSLLDAAHWRPADVQMTCVASGPGSFTGLRIGVVAAKTFAYATGGRLVAVHTLAAIAAGVAHASNRLWTILDAQRSELFVARFERNQPLAQSPAPATEVLAIADWIDRLAPGDAVAGPPLAKLRHQLPGGVVAVDEASWTPSAVAVGRLAVDLLRQGCSSDPLQLVPNYYRKSAAEDKAEEKHAGP